MSKRKDIPLLLPTSSSLEEEEEEEEEAQLHIGSDYTPTSVGGGGAARGDNQVC